MVSIKCNKPTYFDVDDTLIMWNPSTEMKDKFGIAYTSPTGLVSVFVPHLPHIEQLKRHAERGHTIIVWSAGGSDWAELAVKILGLQDFVSLTIEKPVWSYDDKKPEEFMPKSYYWPLQEIIGDTK